jgi:hypothetical protein
MSTGSTLLWIDTKAMRQWKLSICKESRDPLKDDRDQMNPLAEKSAILIQDSGKVSVQLSE